MGKKVKGRPAAYFGAWNWTFKYGPRFSDDALDTNPCDDAWQDDYHSSQIWASS
jgi:hypothetical protein